MPRCRNSLCKQKLPKGTKPPLVCNDACQKASYQQKREAAIAKRKARVVKPKAKKKKLKSIARLVDEAAGLLQKLVRMKAADSNGMVRSFTSPKVLHWTEMQGSHFIQRNRVATKLLEENVHPQTAGENMYDMKTASGVLDYRRAMVDFYGEDFVQWLELESKKTKKYTRSEVEGIIFDFKRQIQQQESRLSGREVPQQSDRGIAA